MALGCSNWCLDQPGWSVDGIYKFACARNATRATTHLAELAQRFHDRYCDASLRRTRLWCRLPEQTYWSPPLDAAKANVWVGFFWQDRVHIRSHLHNEQNNFSTRVTARHDAPRAGSHRPAGGGSRHGDDWGRVEVPPSAVGAVLPSASGWEGSKLSAAFIATWQRAVDSGAALPPPG